MKKVINKTLLLMFAIAFLLNLSNFNFEETLKAFKNTSISFNETYKCNQYASYIYLPNIKNSFTYADNVAYYTADNTQTTQQQGPSATGVGDVGKIYNIDGTIHKYVNLNIRSTENWFENIITVIKNSFNLIVNYVVAIIEDLFDNFVQIVKLIVNIITANA